MKRKGYPRKSSHPTRRDNPTRHHEKALVTNRIAAGAKRWLHHPFFQVPGPRHQVEEEEFEKLSAQYRHFEGILVEGPEEDIEVRTLVLFRSTRILG